MRAQNLHKNVTIVVVCVVCATGVFTPMYHCTTACCHSVFWGKTLCQFENVAATRILRTDVAARVKNTAAGGARSVERLRLTKEILVSAPSCYPANSTAGNDYHSLERHLSAMSPIS
jgi:hypothetical protein